AREERGADPPVLGGKVVEDEAVGDARLVGDVRHAAGVEALAGEHAHGRIEDQPSLLRGGLRARARRPVRAAHARTSSGQRYTSVRRLASAGSCARISRWRSRSSSARMCPMLSGACASTTPHGSTIIERPPERWPPGCVPTWLAATTNARFSIARARINASQ